MSNYTQTTNFATKDALASGNPLKIVKGTEINTEFANIATAVATKADSASPTFTGTVTIPTLAVTTTTFSSNPTLSAGTTNGVAFLNGSKVLTTGSALVFDGSNLGVGVTPSAWASGTYKVVQLSGGGAFSGSSGQVNISQNFVSESGGEKYIATAAATSYAQTAGAHRWYTAPSGTAGNVISFTQAMTLSGGGSSAAILRIDDGQASGTRVAGQMLLGASSTIGVAIENSVVGFNDVCSMIFKTTAAAGSLTEQARIDSSGNFSFNSGYGSVAIAYGCRAWVNFNGTGTVAIRASGNVSSITDNGTGDYTINFTTAMSDANYSVAGSQGGGNNYFMRTLEDTTARTASIFRVVMLDVTANLADPPQANFSIFR